MSKWKSIETAPSDGTTHIRGMWVRTCRHPSREVSYGWQADIGWVNGEGAFVGNDGDDFGWDADDYTHWMPSTDPATQPPTD